MLHIRKIKPRHTTIITTGNKYEEDMKSKGIIVANKGTIKLYQTVLEVGPFVKDIEVGDTVMIDFSAYEVKRYDKNSLQNDLDNNKVIRLDLPWITLEGEDGEPKDCLMLDDRDIKFVFEGEETNESIVIPEKPSLILS